mmetsp:Transcript_110478/g.277644  ORF Transcript_110478/g.277644 Transcript_110478/m.277644 type:complete len:527 (+) Transcript_110478:200-1780(+)
MDDQERLVEGVPRNPTDYVEWALESAGGAGKFQILYLLALGWCWGYGAMLAYIGIFAGAATQQQMADCTPFSWVGEASNLTSSCTLAEVNCSMPRSSWEFVKPEETYKATFKMVCDRKGLAPLAQTLFFFGVMFGVLVWGSLSDRFGRRFAFFMPLVFQQLGVLGQSFAPNFYIFGAMRSLTGFGNAGFGLTSFIWSSEMLGRDLRSVMAWSPNVMWSLGQMLLSPVAYYNPEWRRLTLTVFAMGLPFFLYFPLLESPKWLAANGRLNDAHMVLSKIAKTNGRSRPAAPVDLKDEVGDDSSQAEEQSGGSCLDLLDPRLLHRFVIMCVGWFATAMGFFGLSLNAASLPLDPYTANVVSGLTCIPAYLLSGWLIEAPWCGRRGATAGGFLLGGAGLLLSAVFQGQEAALVFLYYFATCAVALSFAVIYMYASELFPTDVRATSMGIQSLCARVGAMAAPFVAALPGKRMPLLIFATPCMLGGILILFLPETRGKQLPGTIDDLNAEASDEEDNEDDSISDAEDDCVE